MEIHFDALANGTPELKSHLAAIDKEKVSVLQEWKKSLNCFKWPIHPRGVSKDYLLSKQRPGVTKYRCI